MTTKELIQENINAMQKAVVKKDGRLIRPFAKTSKDELRFLAANRVFTKQQHELVWETTKANDIILMYATDKADEPGESLGFLWSIVSSNKADKQNDLFKPELIDSWLNHFMYKATTGKIPVKDNHKGAFKTGRIPIRTWSGYQKADDGKKYYVGKILWYLANKSDRQKAEKGEYTFSIAGLSFRSN